MKTRLPARAVWLFIAVLMLIMAGCDDGFVDADARDAEPSSTWSEQVGSKGGPTILAFPEEHPGPPFYANFDASFIPADDGIVGILFVRDPDCIPASFNLLVGFDVPAAFGCELTVEGKLWFHDPANDPFPFQIQMGGLGAVPVYFVDEKELDGAAQDGMLTIGELQGLPSLLIGFADSYHEGVQNSNQGARNGHSVLTATGSTLQGAPFFFHYNEQFDPETGVRTFLNVQIDIG